MTLKGLLLCCLLTVLLSACVADSGYYWGNYSELAYQYKNKPTEQNRARYKAALIGVLDYSASKNHRVPPGIYAELAFLELQDKNRAQAASYLRQEQEIYPESMALTQAWLKRIETGEAQ